MLADNIILLKRNFPDVYEGVKKWEENNEIQLFSLEKAKDGNDTLKYQLSNQNVYIHSKYNPIREAEAIIHKLEENEKIENETHVIFYGIGLGYHIEIFAERFPNTYISIVEPSTEVMSYFLDRVSLNKILRNRIVFIQNGDNLDMFYKKLLDRRDKSLVISELSVYSNIFAKEYDLFLKHIKSTANEARQGLRVNYAFKRRWIVNSVNNFKYVVNTPNILMENNGMFQGKIAILVSAGPSLNYEIENLKEIKNKGLAFIFSVGSAINTLVHYDIFPHAMCTYDPLEDNQLAFKKVNELGIDTIPMIYGSSVGYETLTQYPGPKYHMITSQDSVSNYFLKMKDDNKIEIVNDAPSIAVVALEMMIKLGFSKIVLVGQNLAYLKERYYADGVFYEEEKIKNTKLVLDVNDRLVETTESFINMKNNLESMIKKYDANVINTTIGGARIDGTEFIELNHFIQSYLTEKIVEGTEFKNIIQSDIYNKEFILEQLERIDKSQKVYNVLICNIKNYLRQLSELAKLNKEKQMRATHLKMDQQIGELENNDFFKTFGFPMNRVEYMLLVNTVQAAKTEKNMISRIKKIIKPTENIIDLLFSDLQFNENLIRVLANIIRDKID